MLTSEFKFKGNRMCFMYSYSPKFSVTRTLSGSIFKASIADPVFCICVCFHMLWVSCLSLFHSCHFYFWMKGLHFQIRLQCPPKDFHIIISLISILCPLTICWCLKFPHNRILFAVLKKRIEQTISWWQR